MVQVDIEGEQTPKVIKRGETLSPKKYRIYTMRSDYGFAPHVKDGWLSLACCAAPSREYTEIGDFVLGVSGKTMSGIPEHTPIYLMQVDEKMAFDEYFRDLRFVGRVDNIYVKRKKDGKYVQNRQNVTDSRYIDFHVRENDAKKSEFVLLSRHFYYFGDRWKNDNELNERAKKFCKEIGYTYTAGGHYKTTNADDEVVRSFIKFITRKYSVGEHGEPNHLPVNGQKLEGYKVGALRCRPKYKSKSAGCR